MTQSGALLHVDLCLNDYSEASVFAIHSLTVLQKTEASIFSLKYCYFEHNIENNRKILASTIGKDWGIQE